MGPGRGRPPWGRFQLRGKYDVRVPPRRRHGRSQSWTVGGRERHGSAPGASRVGAKSIWPRRAGEKTTLNQLPDAPYIRHKHNEDPEAGFVPIVPALYANGYRHPGGDHHQQYGHDHQPRECAGRVFSVSVQGQRDHRHWSEKEKRQEFTSPVSTPTDPTLKGKYKPLDSELLMPFEGNGLVSSVGRAIGILIHIIRR